MKTKLIKALLFSSLAPFFGNANLVHGEDQGTMVPYGYKFSKDTADDQDDDAQEFRDQIQDLVDKIYLQNDLIQSLDEAHQAIFNELKANLYDAPEKIESRKAGKDRGHKERWEFNIMGMKASRSEVDRLHKNFMSTLVRYKPESIDWDNFDPTNLIRGSMSNVKTLRGLLDRVSDTLDNLNSIQADYLKAVQEYTKSADIKFKHHHYKQGHKGRHGRGH